MCYPDEEDPSKAIPQSTCLPDQKVPKKYHKYANKIPGKQLYKVRPRQMGLQYRCCDCGAWISADEEFMALYFRESRTGWTRKVYLALCMTCAKKAQKGYTCPKTGGWFPSKKEHNLHIEQCGCCFSNTIVKGADF